MEQKLNKKEAVLTILGKIIEASEATSRMGMFPNSREEGALGYNRTTTSAAFLAKVVRDLIEKFDQGKPIDGIDMRKFLHERFEMTTGPERAFLLDKLADKIMDEINGFMEVFLKPFGFGMAFSAYDCENCEHQNECDQYKKDVIMRRCDGSGVRPDSPVEGELNTANRVGEGGRVHYQDMRKKQAEFEEMEHARNKRVRERIRKEGNDGKN